MNIASQSPVRARGRSWSLLRRRSCIVVRRFCRSLPRVHLASRPQPIGTIYDNHLSGGYTALQNGPRAFRKQRLDGLHGDGFIVFQQPDEITLRPVL